MEPTDQRFHEGELQVQERAGLRDRAERVGRTFGRAIPEAARDFLRTQTFAILGGRDLADRPWASLLGGPPGFLSAEDEEVLRIGSTLPGDDPLAASLQPGAAAGLLVIKMATRRRMRLNGRLLPGHAGEMRVVAEEVYSNCPKFIQARGAPQASPFNP